MTAAERQDPEVDAAVLAVTSPAPGPSAPPVTATGPADRVQEDGAQARTLLSGVLLDELARRVLDYENAITWDTSCLSCSRVLDSAVAERERAERAEAKLAALAEHRNGACAALRTAETVARHVANGDAAADRYRAAREALEGDGAEDPLLSAACTGPDCGETFADSETGEYLFTSRERMERLLHADGWQADPVLCPACQPGGSA